MVLGFIESGKRRKPNPPQPEYSDIRLFILGLILIFSFMIVLLPFGAYLPVSISIWALLILFLPLLFVGIMLISKCGYVILFAVFLALLNGGVSILFLGDYLGYVTKVTAITDLDPEDAIKESHYKYIFLKDYVLKEEAGGSFQAAITIRARGSVKYFGPLLQFRFVPIVSRQKPDLDLSLYALCYANISEQCNFLSTVRGGSVLRESIWDTTKMNVTGASPKEKAMFLVWRAGGEEEIQKKGLASLLETMFAVVVWAFLSFKKRK